MLKLIHAYDMNFDSVLDYYNAFDDTWSDLNNYAITKVRSGKEKYFEYIFREEPNMYYLVDTDNESYILGYGSLVDEIEFDFHEDFLNAGNIGYGVRPNERRKGYGSKILELILHICEERGMKEVCVSCNKGNIASQKIILNHGGVFEKEFDDDFEGEGEKYWIQLHPTAKNIVKRYIKKRA